MLLFVIFLASFAHLVKGQQNNVCGTFKDYYTIKTNPKCWYDFAADSKVPEIIKKSGYPFEEYQVVTQDGFILTLYRIPNDVKNPQAKKDPLFLMHGIVSTSATWFGLGKESLAFVLSDAGYDVWIANYRGTEYSEQHVNLTSADKKYWDHSMDEISLYDLPAFFDLISKVTGQEGNIIFIGHSLGPTLGMMYAAEFPEKARKTIKMFIYMAPAYTLSNMVSYVKNVAPFMPLMMNMVNELGVIRLFSQAESARGVVGRVCLESPESMRLCLQVYNQFYGPETQMSVDRIPVYFNQLPGGTSLKVIAHSAALILNRFEKYDYGLKNLQVYGSITPPKYDISKIKIPHYVIYTINDWAISKKDVLNFYYRLPKEARYGIDEINLPDFNHEDFVFGRHAKSIAYDKIVKVLNDVTK